MPHIEFLAERREAGQTVAELLRKRFSLTWTQAKRLVENGHVRIAGARCNDPAHRIRNGNRVWIREGTIDLKGVAPPAKPGAKKPVPTPKPAPPVVKKATPTPAPTSKPKPKREPALPMGLTADSLVYVDDDVVVVNKPAGLTTMRHAEEAEEFGPRGKTFLPKTLADFLPRLLGSPNARIIAVHRLDRDTSGLIVFARTPAAEASLKKQFRLHTVDRRYLALVRGPAKAGRIESVFVMDRGDGRRGSMAKAEHGKRAVTLVKPLEALGEYGLVECRLETGRTHQVRIHLGEAGTPLCGEKVYDRPLHGRPHPDGSVADRPMLHAARLGFTHPDSGEELSWDVPPPDDFARLLKQLRSAS